MASRSLYASEGGIKKAKRAFERKGWTQEYLASEVGIETRQPIWKFFKGKPVDRHVFYEICFRLELEPEDIIAIPEESLTSEDDPIQDIGNEIDVLVAKARSQHYDKVQDHCGSLRLLDIAKPVTLDDLYIDVNILEEITSQRWLGIADLNDFEPEAFDRLGLGKVSTQRLPGIEVVQRYAKLMVLGKPGAGKTTFLQHLAIQCNQGHFLATHVPVFLGLKNFAEDAVEEGNFSLKTYLYQEFDRYGISSQQLETLLIHGRILMLLDGLDEVPEAASTQVIQQIRKFSEKYYKSQLVITCRLAAFEYRFQGFTEVEIADFKPEQIENFVKKWFTALAKDSPKSGLKRASLFLEKMELLENQPIKELAKTPVLLNLTCLVFQAQANFPTKRSDLYKQGLDILLVRWDEARGVRRDHVYRNLSLSDRLKLLSQLAAVTFGQGEYFFETSKVAQIIEEYLRTLPNSLSKESALELDSIAAIKSIEAQHGLLVERARQIYSFSHLTFQEYFVARDIVAEAPASLSRLAEYIAEKRWREVFLLTVQMLPYADLLFQAMKQQIDKLLGSQRHSSREGLTSGVIGKFSKSQPLKPLGEKKESQEFIVDINSPTVSTTQLKRDIALPNQTLQFFLSWVNNKSLEVEAPYKPAAIRAFYLTLVLPPNHPLARKQALALALDHKLGGELGGELALDLALIHALGVALALTPELFYDRLTALRLALDLDHLAAGKLISNSLRHLRNQLPSTDSDRESLKQWWQINGMTWVSELRTMMVEQRHIGHEWHLDEASEKLLQEFYYANKLLVDCLTSNCQLTLTLRQEIEESLLLLPLCH
ncbi:NACHT C-terminal helical domain 2-containing protein [Lyngbya aestuarii]|uniref:NACHT C-terminal helical domain 2-containing protein n=1 Tax=Lyngbya aestuarii TaxID=118322 RepID=UPI00403DAF62